MAAGTSPIFVTTPKTQGTQFVNADGTAAKTIYTAGTNGARILSIIGVTSDTSVNDVSLQLQVGGSGTAYPIGGKRIAAGSGDQIANPTAHVQVLDPVQLPALLADGTVTLGANDVLQAKVVAAVTAAKTLTLLVIAGDY